MGDEKKKPGPEPERVKIDGDWTDAMKKAMEKEPPPGGWPDRGRERREKDDEPAED